jgi:hypothetical protein
MGSFRRGCYEGCYEKIEGQFSFDFVEDSDLSTIILGPLE